MRLVFISDTHCQHGRLEVPKGDILFHAGDFSSRGRPEEAQDFLDWFSAQPHPNKVLIAGNHDFIAEQELELFNDMIPENVIYLNDSGIEMEGLKIWGSPIQPWFFNWAFNRQRGAEIRRHWDLIPEDTEILLTHGPPYSILDRSVRTGHPVGCRDLLKKVKALPALRLHAFGHIHEEYGRMESDGILFLNACVLNESYVLKNPPWVVDWPLQNPAPPISTPQPNSTPQHG